MKKKITFKKLENLIARHPEYDLYHDSTGRMKAYNMSGYARAHEKPVTIEWNEVLKVWDIIKW